MKNHNLSIVLIFMLFNITLCSNLFFQWRITDAEKEQLDRELFELVKTNTELYDKFVSNYKTKSENLDDYLVILIVKNVLISLNQLRK